MTSRERFLTAMKRGIPDCVPVAPDISNYIPAKRTGLPFWEIYFQEATPLWKEYLKTVDYFGADYWVSSCCSAPVMYADSPQVTETVQDTYDKHMDAMVRRTRVQTPDGDLTSEWVCFRADPPSLTHRTIKDFPKDWKKYRWLLRRQPVALDMKLWDQIRGECAKRQASFGVHIGYPGFHDWMNAVEGGLEALTYAQMDYPEIIEEWYDLSFAREEKVLELVLAGQPEHVLFGGSGTLTLSSPELVMRYCIPALARWTKMAHDAGIPTLLHCCGKSRQLVDMLTGHTELDMINPLEIAPMGDVDLAEVKRARGRQIGLMGNLHTTSVMLQGSAALVRQKALEAMRDAGASGGFCLSTGDQCGRETPEENLFTLVATARQYGVYDGDGRLPLVEEVLREPS